MDVLHMAIDACVDMRRKQWGMCLVEDESIHGCIALVFGLNNLKCMIKLFCCKQYVGYYICCHRVWLWDAGVQMEKWVLGKKIMDTLHVTTSWHCLHPWN